MQYRVVNRPIHLFYLHRCLVVVEEDGLLIKAGGNVNQHNHKNQTPLNTASDKGHTEIVRLLLQQPNIDLNKKDDWNNSPLGEAIKKNHTEIVQLLKEAGAK